MLFSNANVYVPDISFITVIINIHMNLEKYETHEGVNLIDTCLIVPCAIVYVSLNASINDEV